MVPPAHTACRPCTPATASRPSSGPDGDLLAACLDRVTAALHEHHPGMGANVAIDGSDLPAYANGQRFLSKNGPERERYSDPDASWGHRSAVSTRKSGGYYGYKIDAAVCTATGLPVAWNVRGTRAARALEPSSACGRPRCCRPRARESL